MTDEYHIECDCGAVKTWDTNLAAIGMLWAKKQGEEILQRYIDGIYLPFWKRELDVEQVSVIEQVLGDAHDMRQHAMPTPSTAGCLPLKTSVTRA